MKSNNPNSIPGIVLKKAQLLPFSKGELPNIPLLQKEDFIRKEHEDLE